MTNELLVNLVDSVLGSGKITSKGNKSYVCPFHVSNPPGKKNFEVNFEMSSKYYCSYGCWVCGHRGKKLYSLFKQLDIPLEKITELKNLVQIEDEYYDSEIKEEIIALPQEYKPILGNDSPSAKKALKYLKSRRFTSEDIHKYNIGYCEDGKYKNFLIMPSYDKDGKLNYFTTRSFLPNAFKKYINPPFNRDIIPFELFINWDLPIIICEGPFDAMAIKRNAIPLLGKNLQTELLKKLISSRIQKIYLALDTDALKATIRFAEYFIDEGKEVYIVDLNKKDPSEIGFGGFTTLIKEIYPLNQYTLMEFKLK